MPSLAYLALADGVIKLRKWQLDDADEQLAAFEDPLFVFSDWAPTTRDEVVERIAVVDRVREAGSAFTWRSQTPNTRRPSLERCLSPASTRNSTELAWGTG